MVQLILNDTKVDFKLLKYAIMYNQMGEQLKIYFSAIMFVSQMIKF